MMGRSVPASGHFPTSRPDQAGLDRSGAANNRKSQRAPRVRSAEATAGRDEAMGRKPVILRDHALPAYPRHFTDYGGRPMTAFNTVRFRVKAGRDQEFLDAHTSIAANWP